MALNVKKSLCMRFGPRFDVECTDFNTSDDNRCDGVVARRHSFLCLSIVDSCRYLGVELTALRHFKCSFSSAMKSYFRSFNAKFGKVGRRVSEEVVLQLIEQSICQRY